MVDISKCRGEECPHRERCYRFTAEPEGWQSYFAASPLKGTQCEHFMPNDDRGTPSGWQVRERKA